MKRLIKKEEVPDTNDEIILMVFIIALLLVLIFVPNKARSETMMERLYRTNPDFAADLRRDATREPDFSQDTPLWSADGFKGFATRMPDGSVWITPANQLRDSEIIYQDDGGCYGC